MDPGIQQQSPPTTARNGPPRLLFVDHARQILGGAEINIIELLRDSSLAQSHAVACACDPTGPLARALQAANVPCLEYALDDRVHAQRAALTRVSPLGALRSWLSLRPARRDLLSLLRRFRPDAVISCTNKDHLVAGPAAAAAGVPSVWWVNDLVTPAFFGPLARGVFTLHARAYASRLAAVSDAGGQALLRLGLPRARVRVIHNGIPAARYAADADQARDRLRQEFGLPPGVRAIGIFGRWTPWKGQDLAVELAAYRRTHVPAQREVYFLVGRAFNEDASFEANLRRAVTSQGLESAVRFVPFREDVVPLMAGMDVILHTSVRPEPFGRVLIEAMAAGVPVIAARDGAVPEIISDGVNGLLAAPGDVPGYSRQLDRLTEDPSLGARLRRAGRGTVARRFGLERVAADFASMVEVLSHGPAAHPGGWR